MLLLQQLLQTTIYIFIIIVNNKPYEFSNIVIFTFLLLLSSLWSSFPQKKKKIIIITIVLKTRPDRPVRPVQPGTGSQPGPVKTPKTGQQLIKKRKTRQKPRLNRKLKKKTVWCPVRFLKPWSLPLLLFFDTSIVEHERIWTIDISLLFNYHY